MGGQGHTWVAIEWSAVGSLAGIVYINGYVQALRLGGSTAGLSASRLVAGTALYVAQFAGAILLAFGHIAGVYVAAAAMIALLTWGISGAWLLVIGVQHEKSGMTAPADGVPGGPVTFTATGTH